MRRTFLALAVALSLSGCVPYAPPIVMPDAPPTAGVGFTTKPPVFGAHITIGPIQCDTDDRGVAFCTPVPEGDHLVSVTLPEGYEPYVPGRFSITKETCKNVDGEPSWPNCEIRLNVVRIPPPAPKFEPAVGRAMPDGEMFKVNGKLWQWRGSTDFMLFRDYLDGKDISPVLIERAEAGANLVRVLGMAHYIPVNAGQRAFKQSDYINYFDKLKDFVNYAATFGLRVEFTALADAQILMPEANAQAVFLSRVISALPETAFLEICNEPFKNGCDVKTLLGTFKDTVIVASGDYTWEAPIIGKYQTVHEDRGDEWPRKSRLDEWYDKVRVPVVWDEPIGADEINQPGRRSNSVSDFFDLCAGSALHGAGLTFHSTNGLLSLVWGSIQHQAAVACYDAMKMVPVEAPLWSYTRGGLSDNPLQHDDAIALRTWCQLGPGRAVCSVVRPSASWQAIAVNGWRIVEQKGPNGRLVFLER